MVFAFGLLQGFGFAGVLKEIGLPQSEAPLSLLTFNFGIEAGQMIFVAVALIVFWVVGLLSTMLSAATPAHGVCPVPT
ncbi:HupE/UreJ family protein [Nitratireductor sp.]|uniref:HupE/UreJ family protein n=1 Tax=Nitratireductor sp. TaxID=1872084 RepID=UPI00345B5409|nr:HupE/UreJ family protein [Nitratireductor sp.]